LPEPIGAYYLGFTQHYSRSAGIDAHDALADQNYFEFSELPYAGERSPYNVLAARRLAHEWGLGRMIMHLGEFRHALDSIRQTTHSTALPMAVFSSDSVRRGDILVMQSGARDFIGEPILGSIDSTQLPPQFSHLPLDNFSVLRTYTANGVGRTDDTLMTKVATKTWILLRK
jgi:hypothetical protein